MLAALREFEFVALSIDDDACPLAARLANATIRAELPISLGTQSRFLRC
jgi:hypothetical protein